MLHALCHTRDGWITVEDLSTLSNLRREPGRLVWVEADVKTLSSQQLATLAEEFELHELSVEDVLHSQQRPKLDVYDTHMFGVLHQLDEVDGQLEALQISCFMGARYVITLHEGAHRTVVEVQRRWASASRQKFGLGAAFLMHTLVDAVVDDYQTIANRLEDEVEQLEEEVLATPTAAVERRLYGVKQRVARLRRYALPVGRVLDDVVHEERGQHGPGLRLITSETRLQFRDVEDHMQRLGDQIRNIESLAGAVLDFQRSSQANALNGVTKKLTAWAAIIAVPTFIASVYGMNFRLFPRDGRPLGFWFALGLMLAAATALYFYFKRKKWI